MNWTIKLNKTISMPIFTLCVPSISEIKPDKKFMAMFLGSFYIGEQKQYNKATKALVKSTIRIRLASNVNVRYISLLEYFVKVLGVGKISTMSGGSYQLTLSSNLMYKKWFLSFHHQTPILYMAIN